MKLKMKLNEITSQNYKTANEVIDATLGYHKGVTEGFGPK
jgi:hypothetical protein